ncbi:MAG: YqiA/YcfP family alpha/beta fold hydrolase [Burkholderiales bacterium]
MIVYLHGFNSSPQSSKAQYFNRYLEERGMGDRFACPQLPHWPNEAIAAVETEMARRPLERVTLVGSSLGGFYATWLAEKHRVRAVLINPAIDPHVGLRAFLGSQRNYHGGEKYELTEEHLRQWERLFVPKVHPERYLLLVETGDEALDYRAAVKRYLGAKQVVVQGGDHALMSFPEQIPLILQFSGMA